MGGGCARGEADASKGSDARELKDELRARPGHGGCRACKATSETPVARESCWCACEETGGGAELGPMQARGVRGVSTKLPSLRPWWLQLGASTRYSGVRGGTHECVGVCPRVRALGHEQELDSGVVRHGEQEAGQARPWLRPWRPAGRTMPCAGVRRPCADRGSDWRGVQVQQGRQQGVRVSGKQSLSLAQTAMATA